MLIHAGLALIIMMLPAPALAGSALPKGFVYLRDMDPTIVQGIRYARSHNFVGRPIRGYLAAECILSQPAANALEDVQRKLAEKELSLIVWDCYRPKRAVDDFLQWSKDPAHSEMKTEFYPRTDKEKLFALGYLAKPSAHSRGSTVDLAIVPTAFSSAPPPNPSQSLKACTPDRPALHYVLPVEEPSTASTAEVKKPHSITSSASTSSDVGIAKPIALAVLRLSTSLKRVGCSTGRSFGLAPLRILSAYPADLRK
jgi:D-alanyl-D-alanine dipeptidase